MPHLDICTYIVQYNWTVITFLSLYMIVSVKYLPKIGKILHTRSRKVSQVADTQKQSVVSASSSTSTLIFKDSFQGF